MHWRYSLVIRSEIIYLKDLFPWFQKKSDYTGKRKQNAQK